MKKATSYVQLQGSINRPDTPIPVSENNIDWWLIRDIVAGAGLRMLTFDFSFVLLTISHVIAQLENEQGDSTDYQAAASLIVQTLNFLACTTLFPLIPFITIGSKLVGPSTMTTYHLVATKFAAQRKYSHLMRNTLLIALPPTLLASTLMYYSEDIWEILGQPSEVCRLLGQFTKPATLLLPLFVPRFLSDLILFLGGKAHIMMFVTLGSWAIFGLGLSNALGLGLGYFPKLGIPGVFVGFMAQIVSSGIILSSVVKYNRSFQDYNFKQNFCARREDDSEQMQEHIPLSLTYEVSITAELLSQLATGGLIGKLGATQLASQNFCTQITFLSGLFFHGLGQLCQQKIGEALGKNDWKLAQKTAKYCLALVVLVPGPLYLSLALYPDWLIRLTSHVDEDVLGYARRLIPLTCLTAVFSSLQFVMLEAVKQTENFKLPVFLGISSLWAGVGISYLLSQHFNYGVTGIAYGALAGSGLSMSLTWPQWKREFNGQSKIKRAGQTDEDLNSDDEEVSNSRCGWFSCFNRLYGRFFGNRQNHSRWSSEMSESNPLSDDSSDSKYMLFSQIYNG